MRTTRCSSTINSDRLKIVDPTGMILVLSRNIDENNIQHMIYSKYLSLHIYSYLPSTFGACFCNDRPPPITRDYSIRAMHASLIYHTLFSRKIIN